MKNNRNKNHESAFAAAVEKKIQETISKGKDNKLSSEPKPKSGKGL